MGKDTYETSHEHRCTRQLQVVYTRKMERRRIFMEELKDVRKENDKQKLKVIKDSIGPIWYQVLSVPQRNALDSLEFGIYQDLIEGSSRRTSKIVSALGIYPQPDKIHLINSVYAGRDDPKEMIAYLFLQYYGHYIHGKRSSYDLNGRLLLSAILYLGLDDLIRLLEERFRPDTEEVPPAKPKRIKEPPLESPYLQKLVAAYYEPKKLKRQPPRPLPNLDEIDDPYEPEPMIPKPPPPPPPPPLPKKRLPRSYCDKISGMPKWQPTPYEFNLQSSLPIHARTRRRQLKQPPPEGKKTYGIDTGLRKKSMRRKKPPTPTTGLWNAQYVIQGVFNINERCVFVLGTVSILPPVGDLIHGGFALVNGTYVNIHCGFTSHPEPKRPPPCECLKKYQDTVFRYVKETRKCVCGHNYDYGNEGTFPPEDVPFFEKPTRTTPLRFNYNTIFELDPKIIHVEKEFKRIWENDSNLNIDSAALAEKREKEKKKKRKKASNTCLGTMPTSADYLKCALRMMREVNIAARLPDIQLVPELKEWMRRRLFGPFTATQKRKLLNRSVNNWNFLKFIKGMGHIAPTQDPAYLRITTWAHKQQLAERFRKYVHDYQLSMYKLHAKLNNIMWATMCQAEFPDKKFREIFFSYLVARMSDLQLMHPYSMREAADRRLVMALNRYRCPPDKAKDIE